MMKKTNKRSILAIVFAAIFVFTSMTAMFLPQRASAVGKRGKIRSVRVTSVKKLTVGKASRIKVKVNPKKVTAKVTFKSSNKNIATVSRKGIVRAKRPGRVTITVKAKSKNTKTKRIRIKVIPKKTSKKKKKKSTSKNTTAKKDTTKKNNTSGGNNDKDNDEDNNGNVTPSYETALDKKTSADGVLTLSKSDLTYNSFLEAYYLPTDFTKAKTIILPEGTYMIYKEDEVKVNRTYVFNGKSSIYSGFRASSNQEVINNLDCDQKGTENFLLNAKIVGNGTAKVTLVNGKQITIVVRNFDPTNTLRYQCRKVVNEITNDSMSDMKKVNTILDYIVDHRDSHYKLNIGTYHVNTDCTGYSTIIAQMLNFAEVDCCMRLAGYDKYYGQTPTHQNNLACIDGVAYVIDEDIMMKYSDLFDSNNCHIGYNTYYASQYPELNREGKLDYNLDYDHSNLNYIEYSLVLKKAGRL
ncbi:Ig-like domain-containing protein [Anaerobutyricum hallii]|uniref:Ig-like domain-containing protein n=1 Tax=Anaerobutyricum hallii TaxID=39488 RepID=UPI001ADD8B0C|nr:Ig-like domain-containing protein [Anaerobutyricum hallii]MBP0067454.1 Ig-like domain-containing protein [Anaerobutyricum hallii]